LFNVSTLGADSRSLANARPIFEGASRLTWFQKSDVTRMLKTEEGTRAEDFTTIKGLLQSTKFTVERSKRRRASFQAALSSAAVWGCIDRLVAAASDNQWFQSWRAQAVGRQTP
jgi:hypothetical protein